MRIIAVVFAASCVLGHAALADAQEDIVARDRERAKARYQAGSKLQAAGKYDAAIAEYQAAYELAPLPAMLFNIAQAYRLKGDRRNAIEYYRRYLVAEPKGVGSDEAREHLATLGATTDELESPPTEEPEEPPSAEPVVNVAAPGPAPPEDRPARGGSGLRVAGLATASVGVALVGAGVFFGIQAKSASDDLSGLDPGAGDAWDQSKYQRGESDERLMYVSYGVGAAAIVMGGVLYYLGARSGSSTSPTTVGVGPTSSGMTFVVSGSF